MRRVSLAVTLFFVVSSYATAQLQTGIIRGKVVDETSSVVPGASLTLTDLARGTQRFATSDSQGEFQFLAVPVGKQYELTTELSGFATVRLSDIEVKPGFTQSFDITLSVAGVEETVTVTAEKPLVDTTTTQQSTDINDEFIQDIPLVSSNYTEIVPQLPGVSWNRGGRLTFYQFNIHGAEIWGNGYRVDGASTMFSANRTGFLLTPSAIESMEIVAGGIPAEFGEQYGGVIRITTKTGTNNVTGSLKTKVRPNAFYSSQETGISTQVLDKPPGSSIFNEIAIGGPIKRDKLWHYGAFQFNFEEIGSVLTLADPVEMDFYSFHDKISWQQNEKSRWDFSVSGSPHWARNRPPDISYAQDAKFTQHTPGMAFLHAKQTHIFDENTFIENSVSFFYLKLFTQTVRGREDVRADEIRLRSWNPELGFLYYTGPHSTYSITRNKRARYGLRFYKSTQSHTVKTGLDWDEQFGVSAGERYVKDIQDLASRPQGGSVILSEKYTSQADLRVRRIGLFVQDSWEIAGRATLDYGIRYDRESVVGRNNFSPRLGFGMDPTGDGNTKVFASFGILYSNLNSSFFTFDQTYNLEHDTGPGPAGSQNPATFFVINPDENYDGVLRLRSRTFRRIEDLKNPYAISYSVGFERELPFDSKISVSYNHRDFRDNHKTTSERVNAIDVLQVQRNDGEATYDGVEFVWRKYLTEKFDLLAHYTLAKSEGDTTSALSPLQQEFQYGPQDWDQRHTVLFISNVVLPYDIRATGLYRYASGRPYSINNDRPDVFAAWVTPDGQPINRNSERQPANWTVDLTLGRDFHTSHGTFRPGIQFINLTNHLNIIDVSSSFSSPGVPLDADTSRFVQLTLEWQF